MLEGVLSLSEQMNIKGGIVVKLLFILVSLGLGDGEPVYVPTPTSG